MPGDATHVKIAWGVSGFMALVMWHYEVALLTIMSAVFIFMFGAMFVSPDLDINSKPYQRWSIFKLLWAPYTLYVPHRGMLSHHIILGPIMLGIWLTLVVTAIAIVVTVLWLPFIEPLIAEMQSIVDQIVTMKLEKDTRGMIVFFYAMISASVVTHIIADKLMPGER